LISISLNPLLFAAIEPAQRWIRSHSDVARALERSDDPLAELPASVNQDLLTGHVLLVGYGRVGRRIAEALGTSGIPYVVAEQNRELVESLRRRNIPAVSGDAADPAVLIQAHVARAKLLVVATPNTAGVRKMVETARTLNPRIEMLLRTHSDEEAALLRKENLGTVFMGEHELARAMGGEAVRRYHGTVEAMSNQPLSSLT
jgi:CPA2 family monovalent cation:H+ antiporter-2